MQDRYVGDIGDFAKYSLLNHLAAGRRLGVAWYRYPDEGHNADGKHIGYLEDHGKWRSRDPLVFDGLKSLLQRGERSLSALAKTNVLRASVFSDEILQCSHESYTDRAMWRLSWFERVRKGIADCDVVFLDPDNGLRSDETYKFGNRKYWKSVPIGEVRKVANGRPAIIYHHNSRFKGGHVAEIHHWLAEFGGSSFCVYMRPYSPRSYFVVGDVSGLPDRALEWCARMGAGYEVIRLP